MPSHIHSRPSYTHVVLNPTASLWFTLMAEVEGGGPGGAGWGEGREVGGEALPPPSLRAEGSPTRPWMGFWGIMAEVEVKQGV